MLERDIIIAIKIYLTSLGSDVFFWKEHGGPYGTSGIPDIICCYKGRFLGLEAKLPGGKLTALQRRALDKINAAGGIGRRVETVDDVKAVIAQADAEAAKANDTDMCPGK
ncbi:MAG: VRR-NUC domain-containing protein [bacterium]